MKTQEELKRLKQQYLEITEKLKELSEEELKIVTGGGTFNVPTGDGKQYEYNIYTTPDFEQQKENFVNIYSKPKEG